MGSSNVLQLKFQSTIIAELLIVSSDQPWFNCDFIPHENFSEHHDFFVNFQKIYTSGTVDDWDAFFSQLSNKGYSLSNQTLELIRFIILWGDSDSSVRLRGQRV